MISRAVQRFIQTEAVGGAILLLVLFVVLCIANSPLNNYYQALIDTPIHIGIGHLKIAKPAILWVNEGLMAIFFMLLALEIKREMLEGELSNIAQLALPLVGAFGGIVTPIIIFVCMNHGGPTIAGWPIATTTDVAFMLGIVALLGKRVPNSLKVILVALSIVDDIVAIIIIAVSYSDSLSLFLAGIACVALLGMVLLNLFKVMRVTPYMLLGLVVWVCVLQSGIHATLAGVVLGLIIPLRQSSGVETEAPLRRLERRLHPWVIFLVLPLFVLFNGGVSFTGLHWADLLKPLPLGIILGLFVGKSCGVFGCCWLMLKTKLAQLPHDVGLRQLLGVSALTGIGFTMSLFLATLAFSNTPYENISRQGVLLGSLLSCLLGVFVLWKRNYQE